MITTNYPNNKIIIRFVMVEVGCRQMMQTCTLRTCRAIMWKIKEFMGLFVWIEEKFNFVALRKEQVGAARVFCFLVALAGQSVMHMFCPSVYDLITVVPFFLFDLTVLPLDIDVSVVILFYWELRSNPFPVYPITLKECFKVISPLLKRNFLTIIIKI